MSGDRRSKRISQQSRMNVYVDEETGHSNNYGVPVKLERRGTKLVKPERSSVHGRKPVVDSKQANTVLHAQTGKPDNVEREMDCWLIFAHITTWWAFSGCLRAFGMENIETQRAWREKVALIFIILCCCAFLAFLTFGLQATICIQRNDRAGFEYPPTPQSWAIGGDWYSFPDDKMAGWHPDGAVVANAGTHQVTTVFVNSQEVPTCSALGVKFTANSCSLNGISHCHAITEAALSAGRIGVQVSYEWPDIARTEMNLIVYNGRVVDAGLYLAESNPYLGQEIDELIRSHLHLDITRQILHSTELMQKMDCFVETFQVGWMEKESRGCFASNVINYIALIVILGLVFTRFFMALIYQWIVAPSITNPSTDLAPFYALSDPTYLKSLTKSNALYAADTRTRHHFLPMSSRFSANNRSTAFIDDTKPSLSQSSRYLAKVGGADQTSPHVIMLVTCYSEGEKEIRATLESLANTEYSDRNKIFFIVADGMVESSDGGLTPDICTRLLEVEADSTDPIARSCVAVAEGYKRNNMAKVYSGFFRSGSRKVPAVLIVKTGSEAEAKERKPGNRGKRDSQVILMNFLSKVMFDDRMTPLEYEIFTKMKRVANVTPDHYEHVLMVDADTRVMPDSLSLLVNAMKNDITIMGVCGETRISNKTESWVTAIQVYEYYVSHHLSKAFESMFGGVTCLPGCFALYRIKAPKYQDGYWVPILANPDIVETYSQNVVDTLHKKNLFSLGEDRFLTTLMLRTFPKRHMMFVPQAVCKTEVPSKFSVLLSQRRRWINSTVHNLMELVLVRDLCGTFCFSMQMVVALELFGTVVLPAAIVFTGFLMYSIFVPARSFLEDSLIPLIMLVSILIMPGFLVLMTAHHPSYFLWMFVYLAALPVWNFVLPAYAFWHFDDFGWGKTRAVAGDVGNDDHTKKGMFDASNVVMKRWHEWEKERLRVNAENFGTGASYVSYKVDTSSTVEFDEITHAYKPAPVIKIRHPLPDFPQPRSPTKTRRDIASTFMPVGSLQLQKMLGESSSQGLYSSSSVSEFGIRPSSTVFIDSRPNSEILVESIKPKKQPRGSSMATSFSADGSESQRPSSTVSTSAVGTRPLMNSSRSNLAIVRDSRPSSSIGIAPTQRKTLSKAVDDNQSARPPSSTVSVVPMTSVKQDRVAPLVPRTGQESRPSSTVSIAPPSARPSSRPPTSHILDKLPQIPAPSSDSSLKKALPSIPAKANETRPSSTVSVAPSPMRPASTPPTSHVLDLLPALPGKSETAPSATAISTTSVSRPATQPPIEHLLNALPKVPPKSSEKQSRPSSTISIAPMSARPSSRPPSAHPFLSRNAESRPSSTISMPTSATRPSSRPPTAHVLDALPMLPPKTDASRPSSTVSIAPPALRPSSRPPNSHVIEAMAKVHLNSRPSSTASVAPNLKRPTSRPPSVHVLDKLSSKESRPSSTVSIAAISARPLAKFNAPDFAAMAKDNGLSDLTSKNSSAVSLDAPPSLYKTSANTSAASIVEMSDFPRRHGKKLSSSKDINALGHIL